MSIPAGGPPITCNPAATPKGMSRSPRGLRSRRTTCVHPRDGEELTQVVQHSPAGPFEHGPYPVRIRAKGEAQPGFRLGREPGRFAEAAEQVVSVSQDALYASRLRRKRPCEHVEYAGFFHGPDSYYSRGSRTMIQRGRRPRTKTRQDTFWARPIAIASKVGGL